MCFILEDCSACDTRWVAGQEFARQRPVMGWCRVALHSTGGGGTLDECLVHEINHPFTQSSWETKMPGPALLKLPSGA